ncbi:ABC transporter ATP-binding protein [Microlunatus parietis]|uniref:ATP-binding cassette subfamily B protein n=1 Tax=Microlunatus parietis TaxID=682979 RepID=A0A7Y9LE18_9ACTN|nr:ABC transporter ATP-binding protein [Microlunatus parietis]NYE73363.1 ATP-binding cassette subfamily B protein [Microlunatus parietis]
MVREFPLAAAWIAFLVALAGLLPAAFAALVADLVESLPVIIGSGLGTATGQPVLFILVAIGVVLLAQELVASLATVTTTVVYQRYDEHLLTRVMKALLAVPGLDPFEDPALAIKTDRAVRIPGFGPGELITGLMEKGAVRAQGLAAAVLVATIWPLAAVVLSVAWLLVGRRLQVDFDADPDAGTDPSSWTETRRRARYLKQVGLMPAWAKELRIFGLVDWLADRFGRQNAKVLADLWRIRAVEQRVVLALFTVVVAANVVVLALAARAAMDGSLSLGQLIILLQGLLGMAFLASQNGDGFIANGSVAVPDVLELERATAGLAAARPGRLPADGLPRREIHFENVRFGYAGRTPVFDGLSLRIEAGQSVGIVGLNGAGKTTLIKLLAGLETPQLGQVTVDGTPLVDLDLESWWRRVAAIFQDFVHYELPARDAIGFGAVDLAGSQRSTADHDLRSAAQLAGAGEIIADLPQGLDTPLSRRLAGGVDLSGGQWQRIALARTMLTVQAGARVLVLDEPTAQLDVRAEADIYDRFLDLTRGLTTIVISHRFSTVRRADRILVLDGGRITEDGSHAELVATGGRYARLFAKQALRYVDDNPAAGDHG